MSGRDAIERVSRKGGFLDAHFESSSVFQRSLLILQWFLLRLSTVVPVWALKKIYRITGRLRPAAGGREPWPVAAIPSIHLDRLIATLEREGFRPNLLSYRDTDEVANYRLVLHNEGKQIHLRVYKNYNSTHSIGAHREYAWEYYPLRHVRGEAVSPVGDEIRALLRRGEVYFAGL